QDERQRERRDDRQLRRTPHRPIEHASMAAALSAPDQRFRRKGEAVEKERSERDELQEHVIGRQNDVPEARSLLREPSEAEQQKERAQQDVRLGAKRAPPSRAVPKAPERPEGLRIPVPRLQ